MRAVVSIGLATLVSAAVLSAACLPAASQSADTAKCLSIQDEDRRVDCLEGALPSAEPAPPASAALPAPPSPTQSGGRTAATPANVASSANTANAKCAKLSSPAHRAICGDAELAEWDSRVGNLYQQALVLQGKDKALIGDQRRWIADRDSKCKAVPAAETKSCVLDMTKARLATLAGDVAAGSRTLGAGEPAAAAQAKPEPKHEAKAAAKPAAKPTAKWEMEPEAKSDNKEEAASEPKHEAKSDSKVAAKSDAKSESKTKGAHGGKSEAKPETKPETKPQAKREAKLEAKPEAKPEAKSKTKPEAKTDAALADDLDCTDTINVAACREAKRNQAKNSKHDRASTQASDCPTGRPTKWGEPAKSADCKGMAAAKESGAAKDKERDGFRRILHAEDKDPQYAAVTTGLANRQPVEEVDEETKLENADKKLGYASISSDDFTRNGSDLVASQKKVSLVGTYLKMGNAERFYMSRLTAMLVKTGNSTDPGIPLLTDQAPEELRTYFLKCSGFAADVAVGCSARIRGRVTRCKQSGPDDMPCLAVEGGSAVTE